MSDVEPKKSVWITAVAVIGGFLIFTLIVVVAYLPNRGAPVQQGTKSADERIKILSDVRTKEIGMATSYGWVDQQKGVVRLPVERAMELTVQDLTAKK